MQVMWIEVWDLKHMPLIWYLKVLCLNIFTIKIFKVFYLYMLPPLVWPFQQPHAGFIPPTSRAHSTHAYDQRRFHSFWTCHLLLPILFCLTFGDLRDGGGGGSCLPREDSPDASLSYGLMSYVNCNILNLHPKLPNIIITKLMAKQTHSYQKSRTA
jgi:hypothetical protein